MVSLIPKYIYFYYDERVPVKFIDINNPNKEVVFNLTNGSNVVVWTDTQTTSSSGIVDSVFQLVKSPDVCLGMYVLSATCNGITTNMNVVLSYKAVIIAQYLEVLCHSMQDIPVYDESGIKNGGLYTYGYKNWLFQDKFGNEIVPSFLYNGTTDWNIGVNILPDYKGNAHPITPVTDGDEVYASYHFKYFDDYEFSAAIDFGMAEYNSKAPWTTYNVESLPVGFEVIVSLGAHKFLLNRFLNDMSFWNNSLIVNDPAAAQASYQQLYSMVNTEHSTILANKPRAMRGRTMSSHKLAVNYIIDESNWTQLTSYCIAQAGQYWRQ